MDFRSIQARFTAQATRTPDAPAVSLDGVKTSYRELDERSDRLARRLVALGAGPERPVVVLLERSPELVVATLAVLKAGSFYVPLHHAYPARRRQQVVDRFERPLLVVDEVSSRGGVPDRCRVVPVEDSGAGVDEVGELGAEGEPGRAAYVMFTSGSTGEPKGVTVTHEGVVGLASDPLWDPEVCRRTLMVSPYAFSMSTFELWVPLLNGGEIVLYPGADLDLAALGEVIARERVTVAHITAGLFRVLAEESPRLVAPLREVMTGGDVVSPTAVARVLEACPDLVVRVMYGATETSLFVTHAPIAAPYRPESGVPIGKPLRDKRVHLLDDRLRPVGDGEVGEIFVGGGLARGYLGQPDLTAERFVVVGGDRLYRTGDLARYRPDGRLDLLGRADDQIKVRGFRVEPGEVEALVAAHPAVRHVAVVVRAVADDKRLVAYVVPSAEVSAEELREHVAGRAPDYLVPAAFVLLAELPLSPNGKIDRHALPEPVGRNGSGVPGTETEEYLCAVFAETLGLRAVGVDDDFFDLSGQSMQAIRMIARIERKTGVSVTIATFYDNPTPAMLAEQIDQERAAPVA
ncbi:non-ribosomal peptide synthetase [Actinosynnema sp. NPDC023587]|uniref:non-ribosomal peptide synthetase n=1 Tax=Actinosynnema sp. NPDC023587 TaxID=3154695 RepID=UPI0034083A69